MDAAQLGEVFRRLDVVARALTPDYPKLAVWPDGYYVSTNEGNGSPAYVLDRENMLLGCRVDQRTVTEGARHGWL